MTCYLIDLDGGLSFHVDIKGEIPRRRLDHFRDVFTAILMGLIDRGVPSLQTWVDTDDETQGRFAAFFGFGFTGYYRSITYENGVVKTYHEMSFPLEDLE